MKEKNIYRYICIFFNFKEKKKKEMTIFKISINRSCLFECATTEIIQQTHQTSSAHDFLEIFFFFFYFCFRLFPCMIDTRLALSVLFFFLPPALVCFYTHLGVFFFTFFENIIPIYIYRASVK